MSAYPYSDVTPRPGLNFLSAERVVGLFIENLMNGDRTAWKLFMDRACPVTNTVELTADVLLRAEMQQAAEELQAMIGAR
jgi:hypothetical protein